MKKKILAGVLAAVMVCHIGGELTRPRAEALTAIVSIGILAFNLLGLMSGNYDDTAEAIGCLIENGVEGWEKAFVGSEDTPSWFASGWNQIYNTMINWYDLGDLPLDDGVATLEYSQYLKLMNEVAEVCDVEINLGSDIPYTVFRYSFSQPLYCDTMPKYDSIYTSTGNSYLPTYFSSDKIYFSLDYWFFSQVWNDSISQWDATYKLQYLYGDRLNYIGNYYTNGLTSPSEKDAFLMYERYIMYSNGNLIMSYLGHQQYSYASKGGWLVYDGETLAAAEMSTVDISTMSSGYTLIEGTPDKFITSVSGLSAKTGLNDLSEPLDKVLGITDNPSLEIDTDPAIINPVDAVTVTDIPGEADVPLSDLMAGTRIDLDIPSVLATKFPFCIPFDFIRILSVLCAEPKAPIFRIPISTDPAVLEQFKGNQTIGDIPEDFEPMFEIDEEIVIDLSVIPLVQPICYSVFIISFVILLIYLTPKMINH